MHYADRYGRNLQCHNYQVQQEGFTVVLTGKPGRSACFVLGLCDGAGCWRTGLLLLQLWHSCKQIIDFQPPVNHASHITIIIIIIIIMYIYHVLIDALSAHMTHINLNKIFYPHVEHSPIKTIYISYYIWKHTCTQ